jgi:RNA polymerase primary sigma factor
MNVRALEDLDTRALYEVGIEEELGSSGTSLIDIIPSDTSNNPFNIASKNILRRKIRDILSTLSPRTEKIIRLRFGIGEPHEEERTLQHIGDQVSLTKQRIRMIEKETIEDLRKKSRRFED